MEAPIICALCDSLGSKEGKFLPNTVESKKNHARIHFIQSIVLDDEITEDVIVQRCFTIGQPKAEPSLGSRTECAQPLKDVCKSILKHRPETSKHVCNTCGIGITVKAARDMINHACSHLEATMFKCRHCDRQFSNMGSIRTHFWRVHKSKPTNDAFDDKIGEHIDEISNWIKRCFSTSNPSEPAPKRQYVIRSDCRDKNQRSVAHLCRAIYIQRAKPSSLECNLCGLRIRISGVSSASIMFQHAAAHLEVKLFKCRHCDSSLSNKFAMKGHLRTFHQLVDENSDGFDDLTEKFLSEYLNMIERCFCANQVKLEVPAIGVKATIRAEAAIRRHGGSGLTVERNLLYHRLIRRTVDASGKIKCLLCPKELTTTFKGHIYSKNAILHAEKHLQKPLYQCKVCKGQFNTQHHMLIHLRSTHALKMAKNYECFADKFHEEIMTMYSKCYDTAGANFKKNNS